MSTDHLNVAEGVVGFFFRHKKWHVNNNNQQGHSDRRKISLDGVPIGSGTLAGDLGGITIWTLVKW